MLDKNRTNQAEQDVTCFLAGYDTTMSLNDDASYKYLFSSREMVRDLIQGFIPDPWLHSLDYDTLEKCRAATSPTTCATVLMTWCGASKWAVTGSICIC